MPEDENGAVEAEQVEEAVAASERPEWLPDKFTNPEDLARAYEESQRQATRASQEAAELRETVDDLAAQMDQYNAPQQQGFEQNPLVMQYANALGIDPADAAQALAVQAQVAQAVAQESGQRQPGPDVSMLTAFAENQIRSTNSDYDKYREQTIQVLQENPQLVADTGTLDGVQRGLDTAFQIARGRALAEANANEAQKAAQAEKSRDDKLQAQTAPGSGSRPERTTEASDVWERIKNAQTGGFSLPT